MKNLSSLAAGVFALAVASSPALALSARTFVLGTGTTDSGACTLTAPCRTFAYALTQTAPSGEIIVLGSGGYGTVTIDKAVSIINTSNFAGVTVASGNGITINAGVNDSVVLRGLTVDGGGTGSNGIVFNSGGSLIIDQCDVMNFVAISIGNGNGILMQPTAGNSHSIVITNTTTSKNANNGVLYDGTVTSGLVIDRVNANNNGNYGIAIDTGGTVRASISNSIASLNLSGGFNFSNVVASLDSSDASSNGGSGVVVALGATLALGRSVLMNNGEYGLSNTGGTVNSYKDNRIAGNGSGPVSATPAAATLY
jgi:hypothetical protein